MLRSRELIDMMRRLLFVFGEPNSPPEYVSATSSVPRSRSMRFQRRARISPILNPVRTANAQSSCRHANFLRLLTSMSRNPYKSADKLVLRWPGVHCVAFEYATVLLSVPGQAPSIVRCQSSVLRPRPARSRIPQICEDRLSIFAITLAIQLR
jgi:hypothetical protein